MHFIVKMTRNKNIKRLLVTLIFLCVCIGVCEIFAAFKSLSLARCVTDGNRYKCHLADVMKMKETERLNYDGQRIDSDGIEQKAFTSKSSNVCLFDTSVDYSNATHIHKCVDLKIQNLVSTPICVYHPSVDVYVSKYIISQGSWEGVLILEVVKILQDNPRLSFLDLGCNVGIYTLAVAKFGRKVTALDANRKNLEMVATSLVKGNLTENVRLIWNALSDKEETVRFKHRIGNIGALQMVSGMAPINDSRGEESSKAIVLDDLVPLLRKQSLIIKMDIEAFELKAMSGGKKFFNEIDVKFLLMEWVYHRHTDDGARIIQFMIEREFIPVIPLQRLVPLQVVNRKTWPDDIMWIKSSKQVS